MEFCLYKRIRPKRQHFDMQKYSIVLLLINCKRFIRVDLRISKCAALLAFPVFPQKNKMKPKPKWWIRMTNNEKNSIWLRNAIWKEQPKIFKHKDPQGQAPSILLYFVIFTPVYKMITFIFWFFRWNRSSSGER